MDALPVEKASPRAYRIHRSGSAGLATTRRPWAIAVRAIGIAYGSDVDLVTRLLTQAAIENAQVLKDPTPAVHFLAFGDSSLNFELLCWLPDSTINLNVTNELNRAIDRLFRQHNVEIPFPQRDLRIRTIEAPLRWTPAEPAAPRQA